MFVSRRFVLFVALLVVCVLGLMYSMQTACWSGKTALGQSSFHTEQWPDAVDHFEMAEVKDDISFDTLRPRDQTSERIPGLIPPVVHYIWCGAKRFRFKDYLGVVSAIKVFGPLKLLFHHTHPPETDDYNTWFKDLTSVMPGLEMKEMSPSPSCGSEAMLQTALGFLSEDGGVFVGENIILSHALKIPVDTDLWFAFSNQNKDRTRGVIIAKHGFNKTMEDLYLKEIASSAFKQPGCTSLNSFRWSDQGKGNYCVAVPDILFPRDIIDAHTPFAELARLIFYGRRDPMTPVQNASNLIPRISHFVRFRTNKDIYHGDFPFCHFLSVLSALYVAGFERVYMHVDVELSGQWWEALAKENVTVVKVVRANSVFQQPVNVIQHISDISRYLILYKYGGAYQDFDVTWTSHVPDSLLSYPFVASMDWAFQRDWPEKFNLGVLMTRPRAQWLQYYIESHKDFRDDDWGFNSLLMSYRTYELYPHLMYLDRKLQVICHNGRCHPAWEKSYVRKMRDKRPTMPFRWQDVRSLHVTRPKPPASMVSLQAVRDGTDMFAEIGRFILEKSGRLALLS